MDFPRGHQSHSHIHHRRDDDDDADRYPPPPPPPPPAAEDDFPPPSHRPPPSFGRPSSDYDDFSPPSHRPPPSYGRPSADDDYPPPSHRPPPPSHFDANQHPPSSNYYDPYSSVNAPPAYNTPHQAPYSSSVHHVSHDPPPHTEIPQPASHHHRPHLPSFHNDDKKPEPSSEFSTKPAVRVFSKAQTDYSLTIREGKVVLAPSNPSDPYQQWIKDEKYSTKVKDEERFPSFSLINKATGEALKHSIAATQPVQLTPYNQNVLDESVLWTLSKDLGDGYRTIRMVNNIKLNVDAFNGDQNHGGVRDGTTIVLWEWKKGENQRWKIIPY